MEKDGLVSLTTSWLTIDSIEYNAGDLPDVVTVEVDLGDGVLGKRPSIQTVNSRRYYLQVLYRLTVSLKQFNMKWA